MTTPYSSASEVAALVANINSSSKDLESATGADAAIARRKLQTETRQLLNALEEPNAEVWPRCYQVNVSAAVDVVSKMGLWSRFEEGKTLSLAEAVKATGADEIMIIRVFRQLTAAGILADIAGPGYALTAMGQPYLNPDHRAFNSFLFQEILPSILAMPRTLAERGFKAPTKESGTPYSWANGEELWTFLGGHPDRAMNMVAGMKSLGNGALAVNAYPWAAELSKLQIRDDEVAIVDIAGGQGHIMEEVRRNNPTMKGRVIVQDLASTFEAVSTPPDGVEFMAHDMFTPQPVKDAYIYHYRHIFHDWNDQDCSSFLQQVVPLMRAQPQSKLLLADLVLPDSGCSMQEAVRDLSMFPIGGLERNETQWRALLEKNGLKIVKVWRGSEPEACVECAIA